MIFIDTCYLLALVEPRDALHGRALAWAAHLAGAGSYLVSEQVLWETYNALSQSNDRAKARAVSRILFRRREFELVWATSQGTQAGMQEHERAQDKEWSLTDCISFLLMRERGIREALTYDHHFEQAGFVALLRSDPPTT